LSFDSNTFDAILCCNMLHQMPNPELALSEMLRVLRPEGRLLVVTVTSGDISLGSNVHTDIQFLLRFGSPPALRSFRLSTFYSLVADAGFRIVETLWENRNPLPTAFILAMRPGSIQRET